MRAVIQRVSSAHVDIDNSRFASVSQGLLILLGITSQDSYEDVEWLISKILKMRIFNDDAGKMNVSVQDINGGILVVSQFTLYASTKKGNRPSFIESAPPEIAEPLYHTFLEKLKSVHMDVQSGKFGAMMNVSLTNDGPVTITMDTHNKE